jgi:hypothetical protein
VDDTEQAKNQLGYGLIFGFAGNRPFPVMVLALANKERQLTRMAPIAMARRRLPFFYLLLRRIY